MGVLTGPEIHGCVTAGVIQITDFDPNRLGPNSYNLRLGRELRVYRHNLLKNSKSSLRGPLADEIDPSELRTWLWTGVWDTSRSGLDIANPEHYATVGTLIPSYGLTIYPGVVYLGHTMEETFSPHHRPCIDGRSSVGRLGVGVHVCAGYGDVGFRGQWTLEITATIPVVIYPGMEICQVSFDTVTGTIQPYEGKYKGQKGPQPSKLWKEFVPKPSELTHGHQGNIRATA